MQEHLVIPEAVDEFWLETRLLADAPDREPPGTETEEHIVLGYD